MRKITADGGAVEPQVLQSREACKMRKVTVDEWVAITPVLRGGVFPPQGMYIFIAKRSFLNIVLGPPPLLYIYFSFLRFE